jgi:hypothetical protein
MRKIGMLAIASVALFAAACGNDDVRDRGSGADPAVTRAASAEAYCAAVTELNERGEAIFEGVDEDDSAALRAAEGKLYAAAVEVGLVEAAPAEIREDVRLYNSAFKARADGESYDEEAAGEAEERMLAYEEEHCEQD